MVKKQSPNLVSRQREMHVLLLSVAEEGETTILTTVLPPALSVENREGRGQMSSQ